MPDQATYIHLYNLCFLVCKQCQKQLNAFNCQRQSSLNECNVFVIGVYTQSSGLQINIKMSMGFIILVKCNSLILCGSFIQKSNWKLFLSMHILVLWQILTASNLSTLQSIKYEVKHYIRGLHGNTSWSSLRHIYTSGVSCFTERCRGQKQKMKRRDETNNTIGEALILFLWWCQCWNK